MRRNRMVKSKVNRKQRGVALLIVIFALLLVSGIAIAMLGNSNTETAINQNYRETQQAYFAAQGGIAEALDRIKIGTGTNGIPGPTAMPSSSSANVIYIINKKSSSEVVTPWDYSNPNGYPDTEFCKENFGITGVTNNGPTTGVSTPCSGSTSLPSGGSWYTSTTSINPFTGTSAAPDYKWVRITLKSNSTNYPYFTNNNSSDTSNYSTQVCGDGNGGEVLLPSSSSTCTAAGYYPVYVLTSLAVTSRGTRRMTQREITNIRLPPFPGALTLDGPAPASGGIGFIPPFDAPNSNVYQINGNNATGCPGAGNPAIAVVDTNSQTDVTSEIPSNRYTNYIGSGGGSPDVQVVSSTALGNWSTPQGVQAISTLLQNTAGTGAYTSTATSCTQGGVQISSGPCTNIGIGTPSSPQLTYVNGNLTLSGNQDGGGILVVTGTLTMTGNGGFKGIVLVVGQGNFVFKGGGNAEFDGAVLVAKSLDSLGNTLSTLGEPVVDWSGGGGNGIRYNTCNINSVQNGLGFQTQSTRELGY